TNAQRPRTLGERIEHAELGRVARQRNADQQRRQHEREAPSGHARARLRSHSWPSFLRSTYTTLAASGKAPSTSDESLVLDRKLARTERAIDSNDAVLVAHLAPVLLGKACQDFL